MTSWAAFSSFLMPGMSILKPCQRTAATMQARMESSSFGSGKPKCLSRSWV